MLWFRTLAIVFAAAAAVSAEDKKPGEDKKPAEFDAKALVGKWTLTSGMHAGEKKEVDKQKDPADISADKITLKTPDATFEFKYTLDTKASPVAIDMEITEPEGFKGAKSKGIVAMDGDTLKLAYNPKPDGDRPKDFKSDKDNGYHVYTMKKAKKDEKKDDK